MKCDEIRILLNPYVDKELAAIDTDMVKKHLKECSVCAGEVVGLNKVKQMLHKLPVLTAPSGLLERVRRNLARSDAGILQRNNTFLRYRWMTLSLASAAAVILIVFTVLIQFRKTDVPILEPVSERIKENFNALVMAKPDAAGIIPAQSMLFTQRINISAQDINGTIDKVYYVASLDTDSGKTGKYYESTNKDLLVKAQNQQAIVSNVTPSFRAPRSQVEPSFRQSEGKSKQQVLKVLIPLSRKDEFIRQLQGNIPDKMVLSEMQATSQDRLAEGYLAETNQAIIESEKQQKGNELVDQNAGLYDKVSRGGAESGNKQAEANKNEENKVKDESIVTTGAAKRVSKAPKLKSSEKSTPLPGTIVTKPSPVLPASPAPSAPAGVSAISPSAPPPTGFGKSLAEEKKEVNQDKDMEKPGDVIDLKNDANQNASAQTPEPMIEFIIIIEPDNK